MANDITFPGGVDIRGDLTVRGSIQPPVTRSNLAQQNNQPYAVPLTNARVWDAVQNSLPSAGAADDLGLETGTWGTDAPGHISTGDLKAAGATTRYALFLVQLAPEYVAGQTVTVRVSAGMQVTVADTSSTIDVELYKLGRDGLVSGSDLVTSAAQSCNSLVFANLDFAVSTSTLDPGDQLAIRVAATVTDAATGTEVTSVIGALEILADTQG